MFVLCTVICDNAVGLAFTLFTYRFPLAASQLATATKLIRRYCIGNVISCAVLPSIFDRPHWRSYLPTAKNKGLVTSLFVFVCCRMTLTDVVVHEIVWYQTSAFIKSLTLFAYPRTTCVKTPAIKQFENEIGKLTVDIVSLPLPSSLPAPHWRLCSDCNKSYAYTFLNSYIISPSKLRLRIIAASMYDAASPLKRD